MADDDVINPNDVPDEAPIESKEEDATEVRMQPPEPSLPSADTVAEVSSEPISPEPDMTPAAAANLPPEPPYIVEQTVSPAEPPSPKKSANATLPILAAILTVILLVVIGVAAIKLSGDKSEDGDETQQQNSEPLNQAELDQQLNEVDQLDKDLEQLEEDLETNDITDENVGL